jgi:hypothetical protein
MDLAFSSDPKLDLFSSLSIATNRRRDSVLCATNVPITTHDPTRSDLFGSSKSLKLHVMTPFD